MSGPKKNETGICRGQTIRQTESPQLLDIWVTNTLSVKIYSVIFSAYIFVKWAEIAQSV
jgi:hypothetical protein